MNTILPSLLIFPLFCSLLIPTAVLVWYMRWRTKEQGEAARQIKIFVTTLSRTERMVDGLKKSQRRSSVEDIPQGIETPVVTQQPHPPTTPSLPEQRFYCEPAVPPQSPLFTGGVKAGQSHDNSTQVSESPALRRGDSTQPLPPPRKLSVRDEPDRDVSPGAIEKAKALLKGGIPPVDVAKTLNMGLGEVSLLHRMITFIEHREGIST